MCRVGCGSQLGVSTCASEGWRVHVSLSLVSSWCRAGMSGECGAGLRESPVHGAETGECAGQGEEVPGTLEEQGLSFSGLPPGRDRSRPPG